MLDPELELEGWKFFLGIDRNEEMSVKKDGSRTYCAKDCRRIRDVEAISRS